jgi:hypothetical protein
VSEPVPRGHVLEEPLPLARRQRSERPRGHAATAHEGEHRFGPLTILLRELVPPRRQRRMTGGHDHVDRRQVRVDLGRQHGSDIADRSPQFAGIHRPHLGAEDLHLFQRRIFAATGFVSALLFLATVINFVMLRTVVFRER